MGKLVYLLVIYSYRLFLSIAAPFHYKAKKMITGRFDWKKSLSKKFDNNTHPVVWIHSASLGEFEQARPVIELFLKDFPDYRLLVSFFSPSGFEIRKNYQKAFHVAYLPFDNPANAKTWIEIVKPKIVFFVKYEFWYYFSFELHRKKIPLISFSSIFRSNQIFFKPWGGFNRKILSNFDKFFVQDKNSLELLKSIGLENSEVSGDTRFDRVLDVAMQKKELPVIQNFKGNKKLFVLGSAWKEDMDVVQPLIHELKDLFKFIIVPHEIHKTQLESITSRIKESYITYSEAESLPDTNSNVLVVDAMGFLSSIYQYADFVFVGGAYGAGLHNILEPAVFGIPVIFGNKNYGKFREARDMINLNTAFPVAESTQLSELVNKLNNPEELSRIRNELANYFEKNRGATKKILEYVNQILQK